MKALPPPLLVELTLASVEDGELRGKTTEVRIEYAVKTQVEVVNGRQVTTTKNVTNVESFVVTAVFLLSDAKATTREGVEIAAADLAAKVAVAKIVVVFRPDLKLTLADRKKYPESAIFFAEKK